MTASTIKALSAQLAAKEVSAEELARHYLSRIEAGAHLNAFTHVDAEATLAQARAADARIAAGSAAPLLDTQQQLWVEKSGGFAGIKQLHGPWKFSAKGAPTLRCPQF